MPVNQKLTVSSAVVEVAILVKIFWQ